MPTYEYECKKCGDHFDLFQSMSDKPVTKCPKCKGKVERLIGSGSGIIFKGTGFYQTDYKNKSRSGVCPTDASKPACKGCQAKKD